MGIFDNDDDDFLNEEFLNRWERVHNRMMNDDEFRREMERAQKDFRDLMSMLLSQRDNTPLDFRIIPLGLTPKNKDLDSLDNMDVKKGKDENGEWETKNWTSPDGSISFSSFSRSSSYDDFINLNDDKANEWAYKLKNRDKKPSLSSEKIKELKLEKLQKSLDYAVKHEKYEKAAEIKKMIDELNSEN
jgi:hypothetical protein